MPIINSYSTTTSGVGSSSGVSSEQPYTYSFTGFITIPANEKFLLIPGKDHAREIVFFSSNELLELYFGNNEIPFESLKSLEKYRDNQLGVDLWVKSENECQCLVTIRSVQEIDYMNGNDSQNNLVTLLSDTDFFIDVTQLTSPIDFKAYIENPSSIPNNTSWGYFEVYITGAGSIQIPIANNGEICNFPSVEIPFMFEYSETSTSGYFQLLIDTGEGTIAYKLKIISFIELTKTFVLGEV